MEATRDQMVGFDDLLLDAAALIEEYGWVTDESGSIDRGFCAVGAINHAAMARGVEALRWRGMTVSNRILLNRLISYNDAEGRVQEEVVAQLRNIAQSNKPTDSTK